tara:strand:+ start:625 stop:1254 length:630 start_codon:yes stop_codon:yes gene_type:complete
MNTEYVYPDDYKSMIQDLFLVKDLNGQKIDFTEVCNKGGKQLCIKRSAKMNKLLSNNSGDLFFEGTCSELKQNRFFELIMPEYVIDGQAKKTDIWFLKTVGTSRFLHRKKCRRKTAREVWSGKSDVIKYTDVFSVVENFSTVQKTIKREVHVIKVFIDNDGDIYFEWLDPSTSQEGYSYTQELKITVNNKKVIFWSWLESIVGKSVEQM